MNSNRSNTLNTSNTSKFTGNNIKKMYTQSSTFSKVILWIIVAVIILLLIMWILYAINKSNSENTQNPVVINSEIDSWVTRPTVTLPMPSSGYNYSYSMWFYIRDWNYKFGKWKNIMWKGNTTTPRHSPSIWLYPLTNSIKVVTSTTGSDSLTSCDVENIPLQKWVHLVYVLNNRSVDIYINGKLERTCILQGIPVNMQNDKLTVNYNNGFYGKMGKLQYFTSTLTPEEIAKLYISGPTGSSGLFNSELINESSNT